MTHPEQVDAGSIGADETLIQRNDSRADSGVGEGRYFGRYRPERELGRGGMGVVVLAHDEELNLPVALKLLPDSVSGDNEGLSRFKAEVLRGMTLAHSNIVRVHTFERDAQHAAIVMEYVPGETLAEAKARQEGHCFDCLEILPWLEQLCLALDYAHGEARVAHRDLKPRNIMLTPEGRVKLTDFGLASLLNESLTRVATSANAVGTPPYMSPQQVLGKPATRVDDIYALGATIFDLLTSRPPFFRGDVFAQVLHEEAPSMTQRRQDLGVHGKAEIPRTWERAIAACLSKEPEARPASGAALLEMLREVELAPVGPIRVKVPESRSSVRVVTTRPESSPRREEAESRAQAIASPNSTLEEHPSVHIVPPPLRFFRTQQTGVTKFLFNLVSVIVMAAIAAGTVHLARRTKSAKPAVAAQAPGKATEPVTRLNSSTLDSGRKLQMSSLDAGAVNSGEER